uniref:Nuclear receptor domain-containing protein n=1 Tax=Caenorhabditis tropicalis TaxID=1561998 RepID=A0A1I7UL56_9PELO
MSCEGCKGFFRRTFHKKVEYVCQKGVSCTFSFENCSLNRGFRTRCKACCYKRCLEMGMNKDSVRVSKETDKVKEEITPELHGQRFFFTDNGQRTMDKKFSPDNGQRTSDKNFSGGQRTTDTIFSRTTKSR